VTEPVEVRLPNLTAVLSGLCSTNGAGGTPLGRRCPSFPPDPADGMTVLMLPQSPGTTAHHIPQPLTFQSTTLESDSDECPARTGGSLAGVAPGSTGSVWSVSPSVSMAPRWGSGRQPLRPRLGHRRRTTRLSSTGRSPRSRM
jgi:hypothetical protein